MTPSEPLLLPDLLFEVRGAKANAFLHGQLTGHIKNLTEQAAGYNFLLNAKGKIQSDLYVYRLPDGYVLAVPADRAARVSEHLQKLAPLSQVQIKAWPDHRLLHFVKSAPPAGAALLHIYNTRYFEEGYDAVILSSHLKNFKTFPSADAENWRILQGVPKFGVDFTEDNLPQETGRYDALHFDKGCYLGQEIVTRLEHRGHVNRQLVRMQSAGRLSVGAILQDAAQNEVGRVTSAVFDDDSAQTWGIAWLSWKTIENPQPVFCDGKPVIYKNVCPS